ncbi:hypothetical protein Tco_1388099 [Tanacetum coccineum]
MSHESDNDIEYDPSDLEFTKWLASKNFNYNTMDHYTMKALWIFWARGDDEVELTDKESSYSDDGGEVAKIFRIETNVFDFETPLCRAFKEFNYLLQIDPDVLTKDIDGFNIMMNIRTIGYMSGIKIGCSEWPTCSWREDGYCNIGNLPRAYIVGNTLRYQDLEWYDALKNSKLKEEALKNKAIMEGMIDDNDESNEERCEMFDDHELSVYTVRRFEMIKYSFGQDKEYVDVKEDEYEDLTSISKEAIHAYQEIFRMMDKGWMVTSTE